MSYLFSSDNSLLHSVYLQGCGQWIWKALSCYSFEGENEFVYVADRLPGIASSICAVNGHVPEAERAVRTIKERCRCLWNQVPFKFLPRTLVKELVRTAVFWLDAVPPNHGVSKELTPHELLSGHRLNFHQDACLKFGFHSCTQWIRQYYGV